MDILTYLVFFILGMFCMLSLRESFYFVRKTLNHNEYMLAMDEEKKITEIHLHDLETRLGKKLDGDEITHLRIVFYERTGIKWKDTEEYKVFKQRRDGEQK